MFFSGALPWIQIACWILVIAFLDASVAQFPPPIFQDGVKTIQSPTNGNISISFKTPPIGTCTTVFQSQRQYTGYVSLSPGALGSIATNYSINMFFWFVEARQSPETAPLTIYLNGGPGSSSMVALFQEVGPCKVVEVAKDKLGTVAREWGWDRSSNLVFIDQPVQVGFSYDSPTNASINLLNEIITYPATKKPITQPSYTFLNGTFSSGNQASTANTTQIAAQAVWHFLQGFLSAFPQYNPGVRGNNTFNNGVAGINLFTESYGGKYGPAFGAFFNIQNSRRKSDPKFSNATIEIRLKSLGIINGWVDLLIQSPYHPRFAYNNTYNIQAITQLQELNALSAFSGPKGCQQLTQICRNQEMSNDPNGTGNVGFVNDACSRAERYCKANVLGPYTLSGKSVYDISQNMLDPFPDLYYLEYLNTKPVQQAIGSPVNFTQTTYTVASAFEGTGDFARNEIVQDLVNLVQSGVRVALIYGDRDYLCNWVSGEAVSFAIAGAAGPAYMPWYSAGYTPIVANDTYIGGVVREYGNLSFSRIYDAGHLVPAYQPETAFTIFSRIIEGTDISLGHPIDLSNYASFGDSNSTHQNTAPKAANPTCFLRAVNETCNVDQKNMLANSAGVIINGVLYASEGDWTSPAPSMTSMAGMPGTAPISMMTTLPPSSQSSSKAPDKSSIPTGVYTATGVPTMTTSSSTNLATPIMKGNAFRDGNPMLVLGMLSFGIWCG